MVSKRAPVARMSAARCGVCATRAVPDVAALIRTTNSTVCAALADNRLGGALLCGWWRQRARRRQLLGPRLLRPRCLLLRRRRGRGRRFDGRDGRLLRPFAVGEPDIIDRMLDRVQAGARDGHPAREDALGLA